MTTQRTSTPKPHMASPVHPTLAALNGPDSGYFSPDRSNCDSLLFRFDDDIPNLTDNSEGEPPLQLPSGSMDSHSSNGFTGNLSFSSLRLDKSLVYARRKSRSAPQLRVPHSCSQLDRSSFQSWPALRSAGSDRHDSILHLRRTVGTQTSIDFPSASPYCQCSSKNGQDDRKFRIVGEVRPYQRGFSHQDAANQDGELETDSFVTADYHDDIIRVTHQLALIGDEIFDRYSFSGSAGQPRLQVELPQRLTRDIIISGVTSTVLLNVIEQVFSIGNPYMHW